MRPLELEMTAFGSYAEKVCVPFSQLRQGLYLVAGDTGAGKTTIFDGVVFALYGRASGRDRSPAMLHSDYVDKSTDTVVKLRFEEGGKEYTVHRSIHFPRKRGTEGGYGDQQISALLEEPDRGPTEGADKVTRRIEELLGLNAEQFRKIVMLAQGEFREFLKADSDKKNEILGKLFDNSEYLRYQNLLSGARDELARRRSRQQEQLQLLMRSVFQPPESLSEDAAEDFLPGHPALLENLSALTEKERADLAALNARQEQLRRRISELDRQKGAALELNERFAALKRLEQELTALEGRRQEMQIRREQLARADLALHRVSPFLDDKARAEKALKRSREELQLQLLEAGRREQDLARAQAQTEENEKKEERLRQLGLQLHGTEEQLKRLRELAETRAQLARLQRERSEAEGREQMLNRRREEAEQKLETMRLRLEELDGAEALVLQRQGQWEQSRAREEALRALQRDCAALRQDEKTLTGEEESLSRLAGEALEAEQQHHRLYHALLAGQAGVMAAQLRREIAEKGRAQCPVCGSSVEAAQEAFFARGGEHTPSQEQVDQAKARLDRAEKARIQQDKRREALAVRLQSRREAAASEGARLLPDCDSWDKLTDGRLESALAAGIEQMNAAGKALEEAKALERERQTLRQSRGEWEQMLKAASEEREELLSRLQQLRAGEESLKTLEQEKGTGLLYATAQEAEEAHKAMLLEQDALRSALEQSRLRLEQARTLHDTALGSLQEKKKLAEDREREAELAEEKLAAALARAGFADADEAKTALLPAGAQDPAAWLLEEQKHIGDWEAALLHKGNELRQQQESLRGKEPADLQRITDDLQEENEALSHCGEERTRTETLLRNHEQVLERAGAARAALNASERSWKRLERLGSLAAGMNGEGGRLSFDRYAMGAVFREILEMANRRLDTMSGGRYQLLHRSSSDRRNAKAGLEIQVLDLSTGQLRGSESLSGGEGFFTSLSLALGLADVVQNRAGGRSLDALFIDEGFGSLSGGVLDKALEVLGQLSDGKRLVGIISHVEQLEECIPQKIRVQSGERGSRLSIEQA